MADNNASRDTDNAHLSDDDPFAELTRIMGHDPRMPSHRRPAGDGHADERLEIELENELMGDLASFEETTPQGFTEEVPTPEEAAAHQERSDDRQYAQPAYPAEERSAAHEADAQVGETHSAADDNGNEFDEAFASMFEDELQADDTAHQARDDVPVEEPHPGGGESGPESHETTAAAVPEPAAFGDEDMAPVDNDFGLSIDDLASEEFEDNRDEDGQSGDGRQPAYEAEPDLSADAGPAASDTPEDAGPDDAEADTAPSAFDYSAAAAERHAFLTEEEEGANAPDTVGDHDLFQPADIPGQPADMTERAAEAPRHAEDGVDADMEPASAIEEPAPIFDAAGNDEEPSPVEEPALVAEEGAVAHAAPGAARETPAADADEDDDPFGLRATLSDHARPAATWTASTFASGRAPEEPGDNDGPEARRAFWEADDDRPPDIETVDVPGEPVAQAEDIDVPELAAQEEPPAAAHLDDLEAELAGAFGPIGETGAEAETDSLQPAAFAAAPSLPSETATQSDEAVDDPFATGLDRADIPEGGQEPLGDFYRDDANPLDEGVFSAQGQGADFEYDPYADANPAVPPPEHTASRGGSWRRGAVVAALVAGVAVVGGIVAYALSPGGGGSGAPAVVQADDDPIKVKPENPGGTKVPNEDSPAYRTAEGTSGDVNPAQEELVSTTEEPVDIAARSAPSTDAPEEPASPALSADEAETSSSSSFNDGAAAGGADAPAMSAGKSEDRLAPSAEETSGPMANETIAVKPRRVKTLIVKPDGSIVAREEPAPSASEGTERTAAGTDAADTLPGVSISGGTQAQSATSEAPGGEQPALPEAGGQRLAAVDGNAAEASATANPPTQDAAEEASAAGVGIPATAPIPTERPARRQAAPATPERQVAAASSQAEPAAPVAQSASAASAPAAPSSEWSVQISSQPTVEGAQASYQELAQRYGNLLTGRGVNIVRAEIEGKGTYYRVRIPSSSKDDAIRLCANLKSAGGNCFVSK